MSINQSSFDAAYRSYMDNYYATGSVSEALQDAIETYNHWTAETRGFDKVLEQPVETPWEDKPDQWQAAIDAAHPTITGKHKTYEKALEMVSNRYSKGALADLVNWLLAYRRPTEADVPIEEVARIIQKEVIKSDGIDSDYTTYDACFNAAVSLKRYLRSPERESVARDDIYAAIRKSGRAIAYGAHVNLEWLYEAGFEITRIEVEASK